MAAAINNYEFCSLSHGFKTRMFKLIFHIHKMHYSGFLLYLGVIYVKDWVSPTFSCMQNVGTLITAVE